MTEKKESFLLYSEHIDLINELSDEQAGELFKKLFSYVSTGIEPELSGMPKMAFIAIRQDLDRNAKKYKEVVEKRRIAGRNGGLKRTENLRNNKIEANATFAKNFEANQADNDNDNDNDNVLSLSNVEKSLLREREENFFSEKNNSSNAQENVPLEERDDIFTKKNLSSNNREEISQEEREILENYIQRKKLATKSVKAYASKLISNGDYKGIIDDERKRCKFKARGGIPPAQKIQLELESIVDKRSCAKVLAPYYMRGDPPEEFNEVMEKYDFDKYDKVEVYLRNLSKDTT